MGPRLLETWEQFRYREKSDILIGVGSGEKEREGTEETIIDDVFKDCFCKGEQRNPV